MIKIVVEVIKKAIIGFIMVLLLLTTSHGIEQNNVDDDDEAKTNYDNQEGNNDLIDINEEINRIKESQNEMIDYENIQKAFNMTALNQNTFDYEALVKNILNGEYKLEGKTIGSMIVEAFFSDIKANMKVIIRVIVISLAAAFFKNFTLSFENKQVSEMGFLVVFLLVIASVVESYFLLNNVARSLIENLVYFIEALVPSLLTVTVLSGAAISSAMFGETLIMLIGIINHFILSFMLPFLYVILIFTVLNTLTDEENLSKIISILKKGYEWAIKLILWFFVAIFGLQSFGMPVVDGMLSRTAKQTISIVPVVGTTISEISDIVLGCGNLIKNAFGIGAMVAIVFIVIVPVVKVGVIALLYKLSSAFIEPISDSKLVNCLSNVGDICFLLLGTVLLVTLLFVIAIAMTLYLTNIMLYIR